MTIGRRDKQVELIGNKMASKLGKLEGRKIGKVQSERREAEGGSVCGKEIAKVKRSIGGEKV